MNPNYNEHWERTILKGLLGLVLWMGGTLVFAYMCWQAPASPRHDPTTWELALFLLAGAYFICTPVVFGAWIARDFK